MTLTIDYNGAPIGYDVPPTKVTMPNRAELGNISMGSISPEDPTAALTLVGHKPIAITESACSQPRLFTGWTVERNMGRSFEQSQFVGADPLIHDTTTVDLNAALGFRLITWTDGKRGEESVDDRLYWLLHSNYVAGPDGTLFDDTGFVQTGFSLLMDACDYRGSYPADVLADMSTRYATVINYFVFWDPAPTVGGGTPRPGLFWDYIGTATFDCTISISNDIADTYADDVPDTTCFAPITESRLERTPEAVYSDVIVNYANGSCYRTSDTTAAAFVKRGTSISRPHIGKLSTAQAAGDAFLAAHSVETDRITTTIHVPAAVVGLIQAGMRMQVKFTHLKDYASFSYMRIVACNPRPMDDLARFYDVDLELVSPQAGPTCSYVPYGPVVHDRSSADIFGARIENPWSYVSPLMLGDTTQNFTSVLYPTFGLYGTPNNLGHTYWGIYAGVSAVSGDVDAWWKWDLSAQGSPPICVFAFTGGTGYDVNYSDEYWVDGSNDDSSWTTIIDAPSMLSYGCGVAIPVSAIAYRYIRLNFHYYHDATLGWYWGGTDPGLVGFSMWSMSGGSSGGGIIPPSPPAATTSTVDPTVTDDEDHGYAVGAHWVNTTTGEEFVLVDATAGAAVWVSTTSTGAVLTVEDEGSPLATAAGTLDFVGAGVTASGTGSTKTITIPGASGFVLSSYGGEEVVSTVAAAGATETLDLADGNVHDVTLTDDCTLTFTGATAAVACSFTLLLRQDGIGGWITTWPGSVVWPGGTPPTLDTTLSTVSVLAFISLDGGTVWYGFPSHGAGAALAGAGELLMQDGVTSPPVPIENEAGDDWLYEG